MRKDAHVNSIRLHDQLLDGICFPVLCPAGALAVSDENLRHALTAGIGQNRVGRVLAAQGFDVCAGVSGTVEIGFDNTLIRWAEVVLFYVYDM